MIYSIILVTLSVSFIKTVDASDIQIQLPSPINDSTFPYDSESATCYELLGCVTDQYKLYDPLKNKPEKLGTKFSIFSRTNNESVSYGSYENCDIDSTCGTYPYNLTTLKYSDFDPKRRTIVLTTGYWAGAENSWQVSMKNSWLLLEDVNVIITSWTGGNHGLYTQAVFNTRTVARQISALLYYLAELNGVDHLDEGFTRSLYLVGHSLGAHISSYVGKDYYGKVGRITGLDPAGPHFNNLEASLKLDRSDAYLVDVIHTNGGDLLHQKLGHFEPLGHIDFYPNGGQNQPGCLLSSKFGVGKGTCSHKRAPHLYVSILELALSMRKAGKVEGFTLAYKTDKYSDYLNGRFIESCQSGANLKGCSIPVDFVTEPRELKKIFREKYELDLDSESAHTYYLDTTAENPFTRPTNLIKIELDQGIDISHERKIKLSLLSSGVESSLVLDMKPIDISGRSNRYLMRPFLTVNTNYWAVDLIKNNYFLNKPDKLKEIIISIFPTKIKLSMNNRRKISNIFDSVVNSRMSLSSSNDSDLDSESNDGNDMSWSANMRSFTIRSLEEHDRVLMVTYAVDKPDNNISITSLDSDDDFYSEDMWKYVKNNHRGFQQELFLSIDTIVVGRKII